MEALAKRYMHIWRGKLKLALALGRVVCSVAAELRGDSEAGDK